MSAKVPKADIKARGELDGRAHIAVHDVGNRSSQSSLASIEFRLGRGMMYRGQTVGHGVRLGTVNVCDNER